MLISDSRFELVWFRLSCDHGWIRSGSVNVRKQQQQLLYVVFCRGDEFLCAYCFLSRLLYLLFPDFFPIFLFFNDAKSERRETRNKTRIFIEDDSKRGARAR